MATYTVTVKNRQGQMPYSNHVDYGNNFTSVPSGDSVQTFDSGTYIYVETSGDLYLDGVVQSESWWETELSSNVLVVFDGEDGYITTNYSVGSGGYGGKTLIGGTAYSIAGGRVLIGGTAYSIAKGKTMVDGTAYEIAFYSPITVKITGTGSTATAYAEINGTKHTSAKTLEIEPGTKIKCYSWAGTQSGKRNSKVKLNGTTVATGTAATAATYEFTPDCTTVNITLYGATNGSTVTITTS